MKILIVQDNLTLGQLWASHLDRLGVRADLVSTNEDAERCIQNCKYDAFVLNLVLKTGSALSIADLVQLMQPNANLIFVTDTSFFSDGSIFRHVANARAMLETATPPEDLAAIVHHYARHASRDRVGAGSLAVG